MDHALKRAVLTGKLKLDRERLQMIMNTIKKILSRRFLCDEPCRLESHTARRRFFPRKKTQSGMALISVIFMTLFASTVSLSLASLLSNSSVGSVEDTQLQEAAYVADGGLHYILRKELRDSTDFTALNTATDIALGDGVFSVTYANQTAVTTDVIVTAQVQNSIYQIQQSVVKQYGTGSAISGYDVDLTASQDGSGTISGPANYINSFQSSDEYLFTSPPQTGDPPPTMSLATITAMTNTTISGDYTVPDGFSGYVHVTGNVTISGETTMSGIIVADGNILIDVNNQNLNVTGTLAAGGTITTDFKNGTVANLTAASVGGEMQPLLMAVGDIYFSQKQDSASVFKGLIWSGANVTIDLKQNDTLTILGSIIANGNVTIDSKQNSGVSVDFSTGNFFLPSSLLLSDWKNT